MFAAETPRRPNILRLARISDPATLDPAMIVSAEDFLLFPLLHLPLLDVTNGTQLVACAARDWNASPDQRVFTLRLRPGVKFSNGREVVAIDYLYAMERMLNPVTASILEGPFQCIRGARAFSTGAANQRSWTARTVS